MSIARSMPLRAIVAMTLSLGVLAGAPATSQTLTGTILGKVMDPDGLALPGVTVTVSSPQLITSQEIRATNDGGQFRFPTLPPGTYTLSFALDGFSTLRREDIALTAGSTLTVDVNLQLAALQESITVTGATPLIDLRNTQQQTTVNAALIEHLPNRSFVEAYNLMPGVVDGQYRDITPGATSVHGGTSRNNRLNLDGANINDAAFGYPATDLSYEIIQEIQVTTSGISAEFGGASGGVFNVITKSGGNNFSGASSFYYTGDNLQGSNLTPQLVSEGLRVGSTTKKKWTGGASLGGPILKNRFWFFGDFQRAEDAYTMIDFPPTITEESNLFFAKLTSQLAKSHRVEGLYQGRRKYYYPFIPDVRLKDDKVMRDSDHYNNIFNVKWTATLGSASFAEVNANVSNQHWFAGWPNANDDEIGYMDRSTGDLFGGIYRGHGSPVRRNTRMMKADVTHFADDFLKGSHQIRGGVSYDLLYSAENRVWGNHGRVLQLFNGAPDRIGISNYNVNPVGNTSATAFYAQDQWSTGDRVTLNLGVRFEHVTSWFPPTTVGGVNFPVQSFPAMEDLIDSNTWSPRLGVVFDLLGDKKNVLKGTYGTFYDQLGSTDFSGAAPFAEGQKVYRWNDLNNDLLFQDNELGSLISDSTLPNPSAIDSDVRPAYWRAATVTFERVLTSDVSFSIGGVFKKQFDIVETIDAARPFDAAYQPVTLPNKLGGDPITLYVLRPAYQTLPTQRYVTNPSASNCSFCTDPVREYQALEITFDKRMVNRWGLQGSYVFSRAEGNLGTHHRSAQSELHGNPNRMVNAYGATTLDRPHQLKLLGILQAPWDTMVSVTYVGQSGVPLQQAAGVLGTTLQYTTADSPALAFERTITVLGEAPGTLRMPFQHVLAARIEKRISLGGRRHAGIIADLSNLTNSSALNYMRSIQLGHPDYGKGGDLVLPRTARVGVRFQF